MKEIIGASMLITPVVAFFLLMFCDNGIKTALWILVATILIVTWMLVGVMLLNGRI